MRPRILIFVLAVTVASAQSTQPAFSAADVHPSPRSVTALVFMTGDTLRGGRYDIHNATMADLIRVAWDIDPDKIVGGPNWLEFDRFDIAAKAPPTTSRENQRLMLRALLAERFELKVHEDTKPMPAFALTLGKGKPKLRESNGDANPECEYVPHKEDPAEPSYVAFSCRNLTMEAFAQRLRDMAGSYITSPLIDATGLKGSWDFEIKWTPRSDLAKAGSEGITIADAVDKQLGLKLEQRTAPASVLVVDRANEKPTPNAPDIGTELPPPPPAEFEVATLKPSAPDTPINGNLEPGGRTELRGFTLMQLIRIAWNINGADLLSGAPGFTESSRYDVIGKASAEAAAANGQKLDYEDARIMLQSLLVDRFRMKTHYEDRPINAYTLVAAKPKMKPADPANRTRCKEGPAPTSGDPRDKTPILSRLVTCQNITMAQFAAQLPELAGGYVHALVLDETGLDGAYDFTIDFSPVQVYRAANAASGSQQPGAPASDPNGAISLYEAVEKQLGIRMEMHKRPTPVLVIDHMEEHPAEN